MKKTVLALAFTFAAAMASAGTFGVDYGYAKAASGPYLATHQATVSVKQAIGSFGNLKATAGGVQGVTNRRDSGTVIGLEYSYDFATPLGKLSPEVGLQRISGVGAASADFYTLGAKLRTPIAVNTRLVTGAQLTNGMNSSTARGTSVGAGLEYDVTKAATLKGAYVYTRDSVANRGMNGVLVGVDFKF